MSSGLRTMNEMTTDIRSAQKISSNTKWVSVLLIFYLLRNVKKGVAYGVGVRGVVDKN